MRREAVGRAGSDTVVTTRPPPDTTSIHHHILLRKVNAYPALHLVHPHVRCANGIQSKLFREPALAAARSLPTRTSTLPPEGPVKSRCSRSRCGSSSWHVPLAAHYAREGFCSIGLAVYEMGFGRQTSACTATTLRSASLQTSLTVSTNEILERADHRPLGPSAAQVSMTSHVYDISR